MVNIADTLLIIGIVVTAPAVGELYLGEGIKKYDEAVAACRDNDSRLVLPLSDAHNQWIHEYMNNHSPLMTSWIDLMLYRHDWHVLSKGVTLYNQGCYSNSSLEATGEGRYSSINACMEFCSRATKFAAFQRRGSTGHCICPQSVPVSAALAESSCRAQCPGIEGIICGEEQHMSYRVLSINGATDVPLWELSNLPLLQSVQCAAYYWSTEAIKIVHYLSPRYCFELLPSLCLNPNDDLTIQTELNWFQANKKCHDAGGHLFSPSANLSQIPTWPQSVPHWTGVTAWEWTSDSHAGRDIFYTNWTSLSDITMNTCVLMNRRGAWEITTCDTSRGYICETGYFSIPERTTTVGAMTSTTKSATGSAVTSLYSQGTDIDTNTTAYTQSSSLFTEQSTNPSMPESEAQNIEIAVALGVSLGLIIFALAVITAVLAICFRKLHIAHKKCSTTRSASSSADAYGNTADGGYMNPTSALPTAGDSNPADTTPASGGAYENISEKTFSDQPDNSAYEPLSASQTQGHTHPGVYERLTQGNNALYTNTTV